MFNKIKNGMVMSTLGLALTVFSSNAFSASGPVTFLWYSTGANYYTLLFTVGNLSCGYQQTNIGPEYIDATIAILATAKANGKNVSVASCENLQVSIL